VLNKNLVRIKMQNFFLIIDEPRKEKKEAISKLRRERKEK